MRQPKSIQILGQAVPFVMSFTAVSLMVSCGSSNGGKVAINKTGGTAAAVNASVHAAFSNFNETAAQNVTLSARVEGASMTLQYANALSGTPASAAAGGSIKQFSIAIKMLVDDDDSTKPAFIVSVADTITANPAAAAPAAPSAASSDDSDGVVRATGVDASATTDPTQTPAPVDPTAQPTPAPATKVKPAALALASDSSPGVSSRFRVLAKCADADCSTVNVMLVEREATTDTTLAGYDAKTQSVLRSTVRSFKNVVVDTKRLANEEHDMRIQYTAPTALPTTTSTPATPLTPAQRARGTKTNPSVTTVHRPGAALTPAFSDAMTARQKAGLPISGISDDSTATPATAPTPVPAATAAGTAAGTAQTPAPTTGPATTATAATTPAAATAAPATTTAAPPTTDQAAPADNSTAAAPATAETYVGSEGSPELEAQPPAAGNVR